MSNGGRRGAYIKNSQHVRYSQAGKDYDIQATIGPAKEDAKNNNAVPIFP
jgi:hypothetical protein